MPSPRCTLPDTVVAVEDPSRRSTVFVLETLAASGPSSTLVFFSTDSLRPSLPSNCAVFVRSPASPCVDRFTLVSRPCLRRAARGGAFVLDSPADRQPIGVDGRRVGGLVDPGHAAFDLRGRRRDLLFAGCRFIVGVEVQLGDRRHVADLPAAHAGALPRGFLRERIVEDLEIVPGDLLAMGSGLHLLVQLGLRSLELFLAAAAACRRDLLLQLGLLCEQRLVRVVGGLVLAVGGGNEIVCFFRRGGGRR